MLTPRQRELLDFIGLYMAANAGVAPTQEEMALAMGIRSKSNINNMLGILEERGFIRRLPYRRRAIKVLEPLPADIRRDVREALMDARNIISVGWCAPDGRAYRLDLLDRLIDRLEPRC